MQAAAVIYELIITSFVYLLFCDVPAFTGFPQTGNATVTPIGILLYTFLGIVDNDSFSILSLVFMVHPVFLVQR